MASFSPLSCFLFFIVCLSATNVCVDASKEFKVGDSDGWKVPVGNVYDFYSQWAGRNRFHVGDSLVFDYTDNSVLQVDKWGYYHCNTSNPISKFDKVFQISNPGPAYFISATPENCVNGQRLYIEVMHHHGRSSQPSIIASAPDPTSYVASAPSSMASAPSPHSGSLVLNPASLAFALMAFVSASVYFA